MCIPATELLNTVLSSASASTPMMRLFASSDDSSPSSPLHSGEAAPPVAQNGLPVQESNMILDALRDIERHLVQRIDNVETHMRARFDDLEERIRQMEGQLTFIAAGLEKHLRSDAENQRQADSFHEHLDAVKSHVDEQLGGMRGMFDRVDDQFNRVDAQFNRVDGQHNRIDGQFNHIDSRFNSLESRLNNLNLYITESARRFDSQEI
ncbi:hypothetical protein NEOLEDRAFT_1126052 [Neolentinus lepideus HHB14362 ss-1]|uniref:t-SNARE coiled-coil homology domain-containing protein n=1 Tax=Neolentinus lepideus HHB14362 ss-1 TaxID=1314782 RepID=A0A165W0R9_9AGAM|nr:hypothetical protein NEOLEDRAFT_1126052 [Neolentinus lepideus HHB14362 ss-1]